MEIREYQVIHDKLLHPKLRCSHLYKWDAADLDTYSDIYDMLCSAFCMDVLNEEYVYILSLNSQGELLGVFNIGHGSTITCQGDKRAAFTFLLLTGADKFILVHNHASGSLEISDEDFDFTNFFIRYGNILDIPMEEHMIISRNGYTLIKDKKQYPV